MPQGSLQTFMELTEGLSREKRARILGLNPKTLWRYAQGALPSARVQARIEEILLIALEAVAPDDPRIEEIRVKRRSEALTSPYVRRARDHSSPIPPIWEQFNQDIIAENWDTAWKYGQKLAEDSRIFNLLPEPEKPRILNKLFMAASRTGRAPEALKYISRAKDLISRSIDKRSQDQILLYKTILSNRSVALARLQKFTDAVDEIEATLEVDHDDFMPAVFNGACIASVRRNRSGVVCWLERLEASARRLPVEQIDQIIKGLLQDSVLDWARVRGLAQPFIDRLREIRQTKEVNP